MDTLATLRTTKTENMQLKDRFQKVCTHAHAGMCLCQCTSKQVSFIISKAIALQLDYKSRLYNTHKKNNKHNENSKKHRTSAQCLAECAYRDALQMH